MNKKILPLLLLVGVAGALVGCGENPSSAASSAAPSVSTSNSVSSEGSSVGSSSDASSSLVSSSESSSAASSSDAPSSSAVSSDASSSSEAPSSSEEPSSSSSSSIEDVKYAVTVEAGDGYTAELSSADGQYVKGESVAITVTINDDSLAFDKFVADGISFTIDASSTKTVIKGSFVMPENDVSVSVSLKHYFAFGGLIDSGIGHDNFMFADDSGKLVEGKEYEFNFTISSSMD